MTGAHRRLDHPGDGHAALTGPSAVPEGCQCNAKGPKISHFFRQLCEGELLGGEGHGFYGVLLCSLPCASLRRGNQGEILQIWEGTEVPKRHQMCTELCSAWVLVGSQHSFGELGKSICLGSNTLGSLVMGQQKVCPMAEMSCQAPGLCLSQGPSA